MITQKYLPIPSQRRSGIPISTIKYIVCHDTGNDGSTALGNVNYYIQSAQLEQASAHAFVDDKGVIECIPLTEKAWHVRYNAGIAPNIDGSFANDHAIGVELCFSSHNSFDSQQAYTNYCEYIADLIKKFNLSADNLVSHATLDPSRRTDPINAFSKIGKRWEMFLADIRSILTKEINLKNSMNTAKWVKFYTTGSNVVVTFDTATMATESAGETHDFSSGENAKEHSTGEVFIFWDNIPFGFGNK